MYNFFDILRKTFEFQKIRKFKKTIRKTVFFKLSLDCKDIIECSMKINFKYDRIVMSTIHVESLKHCWVDRGDDEL